MCLYTADGFLEVDCDEGVLEWVKDELLNPQDLWEGDKIFLETSEGEEDAPFFAEADL